MKYILDDRYSYCGYKKLPFGIYDNLSAETFFFDRDKYSLLLDCDNNTDIDLDNLNEDDLKFIKESINKGFIREANKDDYIKEHQSYIKYPCVYKKSVHFSITGNCNYKCRHCFMSSPHAKYRQLKLEEIIHVLDELVRCGIKKVEITGGEPLVHKDFKKVVEEISKRNLKLTVLYTNGMLLNEDIINILKDNNQRPTIQISFDGIGYHDWMRGIEGAEKAAIKAIKLCRNNNLVVHISMMAFKDNLDSILDTIEYLCELGVSQVKVNRVDDLGEWLAYSNEHGITRKQAWDSYLQLIPDILTKKPNIRIILEGLFTYDPISHKFSASYEKTCTSELENRYLLCASLKDGFYINCDGDVYPCMSYVGLVSFGNVLEKPLDDILNDKLFILGNYKARDFFEHNNKCINCEYKYLCIGGCRARPIINGSDDLLGIDEDACAYFLEGYKTRKDEIIKKYQKVRHKKIY